MLLHQGTQEWFDNTRKNCRRDVEALAALERSARFFGLLQQRYGKLDSDIRCALHHAAVVDYARPFVSGRGKLKYPVGELKKSPRFDKQIHNQLLEVRNCLVAHVDSKFETFRLLILFAEGEVKIGEEINFRLQIPVEIVATSLTLHELSGMDLCARYQGHVEACVQRVVKLGHKRLEELKDELAKNPDLARDQVLKNKTIEIEPNIEYGRRISLPMIDISRDEISQIPKPDLKIGRDGYKYKSVSLFARYTEWELEITGAAPQRRGDQETA